MMADNYQQIASRLLEGLSLKADEVADNQGIRFDADIVVNMERFSSHAGEQLVLSCRVADAGHFGTDQDAYRYVATGNYYWSKANGCTLSMHEASGAVYAQHAFPLALLEGNFGVTDAALHAFKRALGNLVDFVQDIREHGG